MTPQSVAEVLDQVVDVLDARGWCQGVAETDDGQVCLDGAINLVIFGDAHRRYRTPESYSPRQYEMYFDVQSALGRVLEDEGFNDRSDVVERHYVQFNDGPYTTKEDVLLLVKKAKALA